MQFNWLAWKHYKSSQPSFPYLVFFCNVGWEKISALLLLLNLKTNWQLLRSEALSCLALNGLGTTFTANFPSFLFHNEPKRVSLSVMRQWGISSNHFPTSPRESLPNTLKKTCWAHSLFPRCNTQEPRRKKEGHYPSLLSILEKGEKGQPGLFEWIECSLPFQCSRFSV